MKRLDQWLVDLQLVPSRTKGKELLESGDIQVQKDGQWVCGMASYKFEKLTLHQVRVLDGQLTRFVSRSGLKLEGALGDLGLNVNGWLCLDVGQSTGGFTDCLLQNGAEKVVGIDVGHDQLAEALRSHPKVEFFEGLNAKEIGRAEELSGYLASFDLLVFDVSFISVKKVLEPCLPYLKAGGKILALIKPQFELGADALNKKGIVTDEVRLGHLRSEMIQHFESIGLKRVRYLTSQLKGRDGNQEFIIYAEN